MTGGMFIVAILGAVALFVIAAELLIRFLEPKTAPDDPMQAVFPADWPGGPTADELELLREKGAL